MSMTAAPHATAPRRTSTPRTASPRGRAQTLRSAPAPVRDDPGTPDPALDEALERISELAARLWAVRSTHRPVVVGWRRRETRCAECGQALPCATLRAAG